MESSSRVVRTIVVLSFISVADFQAVESGADRIDRILKNRVAMDLQRLLCYLSNIYAMGGWPSGLGSELIIRLRRVQLLHCPFVSILKLLTRLKIGALTRPQLASPETVG